MSKMNWGRIVLGGLVAGLIMNVAEAALHAGILGPDTEALYQKFGVAAPGAANPLMLVAATFVLGITSVGLYAAIRPRFGAGARTAVVAGLFVWVLAHVWSGIYLGFGYVGVIPAKLAFVPVAWGLFEAVLGTVAGAAVYKE